MKSMTGFGRGTYQEGERQYLVEIKTVNHRYLDISVKMPRTISFLEENIKKIVQANISRGKVDVSITYTNTGKDGKAVKINTELASVYIEQLRNLAKQEGLKQEMSVTEICKMPDVLVIENKEDEQILLEETSKATNEAIQNLIKMRQQEGEEIRKDLERRILKFEEKINQISKYSTGLIEQYVVKLGKRIKELLNTQTVDENRLAQEVVIYADKCSVEEEITRLISHIVQFRKLLEQEVVGKKIDFLIQEMNRETNTIGSKSGSVEITNLVIDMKTELEDIREQIQNIE